MEARRERYVCEGGGEERSTYPVKTNTKLKFDSK
jgi:hypothetical protein